MNGPLVQEPVEALVEAHHSGHTAVILSKYGALVSASMAQTDVRNWGPHKVKNIANGSYPTALTTTLCLFLLLCVLHLRSFVCTP